MPLEEGVDVIAVGALAFKRFLEIATLLKLRIDVVTDNDGDLNALKSKYSEYLKCDSIRIHYDDDVNYKYLEPQLLKCNGLAKINSILAKNYATDDELLAYMKNHKTEMALHFFQTDIAWVVPRYIEAAIGQ